MESAERSTPERGRKATRRFALTLVLAAVSSVGCTGARRAAPEEARIDRQPLAESRASAQLDEPRSGGATAFGFHIGEERRYAIGPSDALDPGESEQWMIRLVSLERDADESGAVSGRSSAGFRALFTLEHEATRVVGDVLPWTDDVYQRFHGRLDLVVNEYGFPLRAEYEGELVTSEGAHYQEDSGLAFVESQGFSYRRPARTRFLEATPPYPSNDRVDLTVPCGVYVSPVESPALFTILLWGRDLDDLGTLEYVSVTPSGGGGLNWGPGLFHDIAGLPGLSSRARGLRRIVARSTRLQTIRFVERTTLDIGGIERRAIRLREGRGRDLRPDVYVTEEGEVLRVDISTRRARTAWIRLLRASEY